LQFVAEIEKTISIRRDLFLRTKPGKRGNSSRIDNEEYAEENQSGLTTAERLLDVASENYRLSRIETVLTLGGSRWNATTFCV
jgi:hypothetical protein